MLAASTFTLPKSFTSTIATSTPSLVETLSQIFFADFGQVFLEEEAYSFEKIRKDIGFGFRWITPIAPFRFEWAYPYDDEKKSWGDMRFIFNIGY